MIAAEIAKKFEASVTLIHVYTVIPAIVMPQASMQPASAVTNIGPVLPPSELAEVAQAGEKAGERILMDAKKMLESKNLSVETLLVEGEAVHEIVQVAKEGNFDLIVMGVRGLGKLQELILGSVGDGVLRNAQCPVLITK